jgi:hypothetical protein
MDFIRSPPQLSHAIGMAVRELAGSLPQFFSYAAASRRQASHEME